MFLTILPFFFIFYSFDKFLEKNNINGRYYINHFIGNMIISYYSFFDVLYCFTNFTDIFEKEYSMLPINITFALHFYHIAAYYNSFVFDDWLHHLLMIGFCLPFGLYAHGGIIINTCLFFLSGFPGGINYLFLAFQRNDMIPRITQKRVNNFLNLWIRQPGCILCSTLGVLYINYNYDKFNMLQIIINYLIAITVYWNGIYFMEQVHANYIKNIK